MLAMLNRAALRVSPLAPYIEWAKSLDDSGLTPEGAREQTVYLVPEFENEAEAEKVLKAVYAEVFARELFAWHPDENDWPKRRTYALFRQWFSVELDSMVEDLCAYPIEDDEDEEGDA